MTESTQEERFDPALKDMMDDILLRMPGVKGGKAFGYPAYKVNGRIFAFVSHKISIKLPESRVKALIAEYSAMQPFMVDEQIVWKAWLSILPNDEGDYEQYESLFMESVEYVAQS